MKRVLFVVALALPLIGIPGEDIPSISVMPEEGGMQARVHWKF